MNLEQKLVSKKDIYNQHFHFHCCRTKFIYWE